MENTSLAAKGALAHHRQRCTACNATLPAKSKIDARGPQNRQRGSTPRFLDVLKQLLLNKFFDPSTPSMRKVRDGENMDVQWGYMLFRGVICCSGGLYAVQEGYMDVQWGYMLFRGVI